MLDRLAVEYGWTPEYVLNHMTRRQVEALLSAINRRYEREKKAMEEASRKGGRGMPRNIQSQRETTFNENLPPATMAKLGIKKGVF